MVSFSKRKSAAGVGIALLCLVFLMVGFQNCGKGFQTAENSNGLVAFPSQGLPLQETGASGPLPGLLTPTPTLSSLPNSGPASAGTTNSSSPSPGEQVPSECSPSTCDVWISNVDDFLNMKELLIISLTAAEK